MASSKHRKNHKQKLAARNSRLANEKSTAQKLQKEFIMNLIKEEQAKGLFENTTPVNGIEGPIIDGPSI